jgi:hypothetical protein
MTYSEEQLCVAHFTLGKFTINILLAADTDSTVGEIWQETLEHWLCNTKFMECALASGSYCVLRRYSAAQRTPGSFSDTMVSGPCSWKLDGRKRSSCQGREFIFNM